MCDLLLLKPAVVQSLSHVWLLVIPWTAHTKLPCPSLFLGVCANSCLFNQWCHPTISSSFSSSCPAFNLPHYQGILQWFSLCQLHHQCFQWLSFRMDWFDLLAVQGTLMSLLQHHSSKASVPQLSAFFMVHVSHPYITIGKTIALTIWTFVSKVMSLFFNTLSSFVIAFHPRSKHLLISWL